jgi:hypothetical protein
MSVSRYLPAIFVVVTNLGTGIWVRQHQPDYPLKFMVFQLAMLGLCLLLATRPLWLWISAVMLLCCGVLLTGFSVGLFYAPTVLAAVLERMLRRPC